MAISNCCCPIFKPLTRMWTHTSGSDTSNWPAALWKADKISQCNKREDVNEREGRAGRDNGAESGALDAEDSGSVTGDPFSRPVRPVFVMSDVSIKTRSAIRNHPLPTTGLPPWPRCSAGITVPFHLTTLHQTLSVFLPLLLSNTHPRGPHCPWRSCSSHKGGKEQWAPKYRAKV